MSAPALDYEQLLRDAITQAKAGPPQVADDLQRFASQAATAIANVSGGAAALDLAPLPTSDGAPPAFQLTLRRTDADGSSSDLGVYQMFDTGYPVCRW